MIFVAFVKHFEIHGPKGSVGVVSSKRQKAVKLRSEVIFIFLSFFLLAIFYLLGRNY